MNVCESFIIFDEKNVQFCRSFATSPSSRPSLGSFAEPQQQLARAQVRVRRPFAAAPPEQKCVAAVVHDASDGASDAYDALDCRTFAASRASRGRLHALDSRG